MLLVERGPPPVGIESAVGEPLIGAEVFDQVRHSAQAMRLTGHQPEIDEVARAVGQHEYPVVVQPSRTWPHGLAESPIRAFARAVDVDDCAGDHRMIEIGVRR